MTLEPPRNRDGTVKPVADGILGGPHTLDGLLDIARAAGDPLPLATPWSRGSSGFKEAGLSGTTKHSC